MKYPKLRELKEAIRALFGRRYTTRFPAEPARVPPGFRGAPRFQEEKCIGCGACAVVCPAKDIEITDGMKDGKGVRRLTIHYDDCIFCAQCARYCVTGEGIVMTEDFDLASGDRHRMRDSIEKELVLCERCGEPVAARDHLLWIAKRVGASAYSNPTLFLPLLESLGGNPVKGEPDRGAPAGRGERMKILCPKHRRQATLEFSLEG